MKNHLDIEEDLKIIPIGSGILMFGISDEKMRDFIAEHSLWVVKGACMVIHQWKEGILLHKIDFSAMKYWIQVFNLPLEYINAKKGMCSEG